MFFTDSERRVLSAALERVVPGAGEWGVDGYVAQLLDAFSYDPPRIWAGGPFSGRRGGDAGFDQWLPLGPMEAHAWRQRIDGWRAAYRDGLAALGADFADVDGDEQDRRLHADSTFGQLLYEHACEGAYGDPVYGGNRDGAAWAAIGFAGDSQPRGYTPVEVSER